MTPGAYFHNKSHDFPRRSSTLPPVKHTLILLGFFGFLGFFSVDAAQAAYPTLTYRHQHLLFTVDPDRYPTWHGTQEIWTLNGQQIIPLPDWRVDGDTVPPLPAGVESATQAAWNTAAIHNTLAEQISANFDRPAGAVTIGRSASGSITFDGVGMMGRKADLAAATAATVRALEEGTTDIVLTVSETQPEITVTDAELARLGIREVVTVGESDFTGSPTNRRININVGLGKFNGHLIAQGEQFSFGKILGPVDGSTGYVKELVIKGDKTEPDYGGGLCQVSTTAYRGVWEYGFPIEQRKNHSYAVSYYGPQGTDATVYPPNPDMKFLNDSPSALLIQTYTENSHAYFIYYGTRDARTTEVWGPVILGTRAPPPDRTIFTTDLPPGVRRKVGDRHAGITTVWYRNLQPETGSGKTETVLSVYEARPLFYEVGVEALPTDTLEGVESTPIIDL